MTGFLVLGAGGHAKVVADILLTQNIPVKGFLDDDNEKWGTRILGLPILGPIDSYAYYKPSGLIIGIGTNGTRRMLIERLNPAAGHLWQNAIHPTSVVAASVQLGKGVVIAANAVINADSVIGDHVIINTSATVDHDCRIGDYTHVAPGVNLAGGVCVGQESLIGIGAAVIPYRTIGSHTIIGAGAAVVKNVPDGVIAKGIPARW